MPDVRTTIRIEDDLFRRLKERAAKTGRTIGEIVEDALRQSFQRSKTAHAEVPPLPVFGGSGVMPGVDLESNLSLRELMDEDQRLDALR
jgi:hypothetical protein